MYQRARFTMIPMFLIGPLTVRVTLMYSSLLLSTGSSAMLTSLYWILVKMKIHVWKTISIMNAKPSKMNVHIVYLSTVFGFYIVFSSASANLRR